VRGNRGFALVLTLVVTALMVAVLTELIHQVYVDTSLSRSFRDGQQASLIAESGIRGGIIYVQTMLSGKNYSWPFDPLKPPEDETGSIEITAIEESGKINLNFLVTPNGNIDQFTQDALLRLGKRLKIPDDVWNALADWLDKNDEQRSGGAETPYYQTLKPPYKARNDKMATVAELSLIKGFTPEIIALLKPFVTVYSDQPGSLVIQQTININTAPKEVLAALSNLIDDSKAERILEERRVSPFKSVADLSRVSGLESLATSLQGYATAKGNVFRITSVARVKDSARTVEAVVRNGAILSWQEY
jgi:general secretion pathway protein K